MELITDTLMRVVLQKTCLGVPLNRYSTCNGPVQTGRLHAIGVQAFPVNDAIKM